MKITFINADLGYAEHLDAYPYETVKELVERETKKDISKFHFKVNGEKVQPSQELKEGDRIVIVPKHVYGDGPHTEPIKC